MKKYLLGLTILLALTVCMPVSGQKHRHTPQAELVDSTSQDAIEVFSDTTSTDTASAHRTVTRTIRTPWKTVTTTYDADDEEMEELEKNLTMFNRAFTLIPWGAVTSVFLIIMLVILMPIMLMAIVIIVVVRHSRKRSRQRMMDMAQMASQQEAGAAPKQAYADWTQESQTIEDDYQKGLRQCFVGVGLMIFLGLTAGNVGFGIGALVFCIGLGKVFGAKKAKQLRDEHDINRSGEDHLQNKD